MGPDWSEVGNAARTKKRHVRRIFTPTRLDAGPWYGLTAPQREMLARAVEIGYYSIPRGITTEDLAAEFEISDQAVTDRLRRAIATLVANPPDVARTRTDARNRHSLVPTGSRSRLPCW